MLIDLLDTVIDGLTDTVGALYTVLSCVPLLILASAYVLTGLALTFLCRAARRGAVWMAWVPFARLYLLGLMADVYTHDRVLRGEVSPRYAPSVLRRRLLGFSIARTVLDCVTVFCATVTLFTGLSGLLLAFFGGYQDDTDMGDVGEGLLGVFLITLLISVITLAAAAVFRILYAVACCKAHYRLFFMLGAHAPALWATAAVLIPVTAAVMLFVFTVKNRKSLTETFYPSAVEPEEESNGQATPSF